MPEYFRGESLHRSQDMNVRSIIAWASPRHAKTAQRPMETPHSQRAKRKADQKTYRQRNQSETTTA